MLECGGIGARNERSEPSGGNRNGSNGGDRVPSRSAFGPKDSPCKPVG